MADNATHPDKTPLVRSSPCPRCKARILVWYEPMQRRLCPCVIAFDEQHKWRWEPKPTQETTLFGAR